jgi:UDP-2,3-diacylglucosamine pyrophosphatase LpxH
LLIAHLSDLHLRDAGDVVWLERQLDRIAARGPDHLAITGDLLDRWSLALLRRSLAALRDRGLLTRERTTILHGNHDLASSGGHPRRRLDLWRLAMRFWDPPPLIAARRRRFYRTIEAAAPGVAACAPFVKDAAGLRLAVLDSVPVPWRPIAIAGRRVVVRHAIGCIRTRQAAWLASLDGAAPLVALVHHYPLPVSAFSWSPSQTPGLRALRWLESVDVPMEIPARDRASFWRAAAAARTQLVLCGHVHRARLDRHQGIPVGLNGQSGAAWAGHTIAWYDVGERDVKMSTERVG